MQRLQELLDAVVKESKIKGLTLNSKKTEVMMVSRKNDIPKYKITIDNKVLKQVGKFKYLGTMVTSDGKCLQEIKSRTAQAKSVFQKMKSVLTNPKLTFKVRRRILQCYIEPIMLYGSEAWTINQQVQKHIETTEMWFLRRMLRIPWTARKTNEEVLNEAGETRKLLITTRRRQAKFFGYVMRRKQLEHLVTRGKLNGKRCRDRQRQKILDMLADWMGH